MFIRLKILLAFLLITLVVYQAMAKGPAGVMYTRHNLANWNPNATHFKSTNVNEVCVFCHTPHMASGWPLWNKDVSVRVDRNTGATTPVVFLAYTTNYTPMPQSLGYETLLCMSCHDGVSSMGVLHNNPNSVGEGINVINFVSNADQIGDITSFDSNGFRVTGFADIGDASVFGGAGIPFFQDRASGAYDYYQNFGMMFAPYKDPTTGELLGNTADHPISINYDNVVSNPAAAGKFQPKAATGLPFFGQDKSQLECTTCHDPHVNYVDTASGGDPRYKPFLAAPNTSSALCFRCHIK
jgi:hypothetical protein